MLRTFGGTELITSSFRLQFPDLDYQPSVDGFGRWGYHHKQPM